MKILILLLLTLLTASSQAQKNFKDGLVILQGGDTLRGQIDHKEWTLNPVSILFRQNETTTQRKYGVEDVKYFEITGKESFHTATLRISMDPIDMNEVKVKDTTYREGTVFLKVLQTGPVAGLYYYRDKLKERFYVRENGKVEYFELEFHRYQEYDYVSIIRTDYTYRDQLTAIATSANVLTPQLLQKIRTSAYKLMPLIRVISEINGAGKKDILKSSNAGKVSMFVGGGMQQVTYSSKGTEFYTQNPGAKTSVSPHLAVGVNLFSNRHTQKMMIRAELGFSTRKNISEGINGMYLTTRNDVKAVHESKGMVISFSPRLLYNLYNTEKLKIPLGIGASAHYASYPKNTYTESDAGDGTILLRKDDYFELEKLYLSSHLTAGIIFNNKWEASVFYQPRTAITNYNFFSIGNTILQFQVIYWFR